MRRCRPRSQSGDKKENMGALGLLSVRHEGIMHRKGSESTHIKDTKVVKM